MPKTRILSKRHVKSCICFTGGAQDSQLERRGNGLLLCPEAMRSDHLAGLTFHDGHYECHGRPCRYHLQASEAWYTQFFGRPADAHPMDGLCEWHTEQGPIQLVTDAKRAGGSLLTLEVKDFDSVVKQLAERDIEAESVDQTSFSAAIATVLDPDGNGLTLLEFGK